MTNLKPGDILLISLPVHIPKGHEQEGLRPAVIAAVPKNPLRYPVIIVAPLTTNKGLWVSKNPDMYFCIEAGEYGLAKDSVVLIDQIRSVDVKRVKSLIGTIKGEEFINIKKRIINLFL